MSFTKTKPSNAYSCVRKQGVSRTQKRGKDAQQACSTESTYRQGRYCYYDNYREKEGVCGCERDSGDSGRLLRRGRRARNRLDIALLDDADVASADEEGAEGKASGGESGRTIDETSLAM